LAQFIHSSDHSTTMAQNSTLATVQEAGFGSFVYFCRDVTSYPFCNLFYKQNLTHSTYSSLKQTLRSHLQQERQLVSTRPVRINRRRAAVGRIEIRSLFILYAISLLFQLVTSGSVLEQGSLPLVLLTGIHAGIVVALFWCLLGNGIVATQVCPAPLIIE
ncbi:4776_t:CDS:2, partial [Acaulospora colombiana]